MDMKRLSLWIPIFSLLSLVFLNLLIFFRTPLPVYPLMNVQDALDLLTPLALLPVYWILFRLAGREAPGLGAELAFVALAALWVLGQGIHLAANALDNLMEAQAGLGLIPLEGNDLYRLTYFFDEGLGHILWHLGILGLAAVLIAREWRQPGGERTAVWPVALSGLLYGFILFAITVEGQTVWLGLPFAVIVVGFGLLRGIRKLGQRPVLAFFLVACCLACVLYLGWGVYWGGFPEFGEVGLL